KKSADCFAAIACGTASRKCKARRAVGNGLRAVPPVLGAASGRGRPRNGTEAVPYSAGLRRKPQRGSSIPRPATVILWRAGQGTHAADGRRVDAALAGRRRRPLRGAAP